MNETRGDDGKSGASRKAVRYLRLHARAYALGTVVLFLVDLITPGPWWFFWPAFAWGALVFLHYMYVKSISADDEWAAHRAAEVADRAYDLGHIENIRDRYERANSGGRGNPRTGDRPAASSRDPSERKAR
ncbi:MAG: 2TM domain-containing protein [Kiloniellaceae bacterium]